MSFEEQLREDLHRSSVPPTLVPPPDLAGAVLQGLRRQRRRRMAAAVLGAVVAVVVAVPVVTSLAGGEPVEPVAPDFHNPVVIFPAPGGGPQAVHVYLTGDPDSPSFLLDPASGEYGELPFERVLLSPDLTTAAVATFDGRTGVAERAALLARGESAVDWLDLPPGSGLAWSPDGAALLLTSVTRDETPSPVSFSAHRYELATGQVTDTPIGADILGSSVGWAADSRRYLALLAAERGTDTVEPGGLQYIEPDGTLTGVIDLEGGLVGGAESYSPSRSRLVVDSSGIMSARRIPSKVVDVELGQVAATLPPGQPVGWYDETTVALLVRDHTGNGAALELVDVVTGTVADRIELPDLPPLTAIQLGPSDGLTGQAAAYGF